MTVRYKILWQMFLLSGLVILLDLAGGYLSLEFTRQNFFEYLELLLPVLAILLHALWTLGNFRGPFLLLLAGLTGFIFEAVGVNFGTAFGSYYVYNIGGLSFLGVPLIVAFYWAVFIYTGYSLTNSFVYWLKGHKPSLALKNYLLLPLLIIFDGLFVVIIDLFMDPVMVAWGRWHWLGSGAYFNIPWENFTGWFLVTVIATGLFRLFEYSKPKFIRLAREIYLIPVAGYLMIYLSLLYFSLQLKLFSLSLIGSLLMLPVIVLNLILYFKSWKH